MSKSKASKMRRYAAQTGRKTPEKAGFDCKKMLTGTGIPSEQTGNNLQTGHNRMIRRIQRKDCTRYGNAGSNNEGDYNTGNETVLSLRNGRIYKLWKKETKIETSDKTKKK